MTKVTFVQSDAEYEEARRVIRASVSPKKPQSRRNQTTIERTTMSSHSNATQAHDFYYRGVDLGETKFYNRCSLNYRGDDAVSYSTVIAKVIPRKGYRKEDVKTSKPHSGLTLVSFHSMTKTTSKHIGDIRFASPFETISVPFKCGWSHVFPEDLPGLFYDSLYAYSKGLNRQENRHAFATLVAQAKYIIAEASKEWSGPLRRDRKLKKLMSVDVGSAAEELKAKARKAAAKAAVETREALKAFKGLHGAEYLELMRMLHNPWNMNAEIAAKGWTDGTRKALRRKLCASGNAYVWLEDGGETVRTSKGVRVSVKEARVAMKLWASGKDMRTYKVGSYSVVSYQGGTIQIGCHKIPRENLVALYEAVVGEPFPEPKEAQP